MGFIADSPKTWKDATKSMPEPKVTEAEMLEILEYRLQEDDEGFKKLVKHRGGCNCHINPPCSACCSPLTIDEAEALGWL